MEPILNPIEPPVVEHQEAAPPVPSNGQFFAAVFGDPFKLGEMILIKARWVFPFIISAILLSAFTVATKKQMLDMVEKNVRKSFAQSNNQMSAQQVEEIVDLSRKGTSFLAPVMAAVNVLLFAAIGAGLWMFVANLLMGGSAKFPQVFAAIMWLELITSLSVLIKVPMILIRDTFDVPFGPAVLFAEGSKGYWYSVANGLDFFMIWQLIATGICFAGLYRWSKEKTVSVVVVTYIVFLLLAASLSSIGTMNFSGS